MTHLNIHVDPTATEWPRWRVVLIRIWSLLLTVQALLMAQGILWVGSVGPDEQFMAASSTVWKLLSLGGVALVMWSGGRNVAGYWAIAVGQCVWLVAGIIAPVPDQNGPLLSAVNVVIFYGPLVALRPHRHELLHPHFRWSPQLLSLALIGAVPLVAFALALPDDDTEVAFDMVGLYLVVPAMAVLAAGRPRGGRLFAVLVGAGAVWTGLAAIAFPDDLYSLGRMGGAFLIAGGLLFSVVGWRDSRADTDKSSDT